MTTRASLSFLGFVLGWAGMMGGCASQEEPAAPRRPAMPRMAPSPTPRSSPVSEAERLAQARREAMAGDFTGAVRTLSGVTDTGERVRLTRELATALAQAEPRRAAGLALALPPGSAQLAALDLAAGALARADAEAAMRWALEVTSVPHGMPARRAVANHVVQADARGAIDRMLALPATEARDEMLGYAAAAWARRDADAAVGWVRGLEDSALKQRLVSSVGFEIAQAKPDRAMDLVDLLPEGRNRWLLIGALAQTWVATDAKAAFAWANRLPAGEARDAAMAGFDAGLGLPTSRRLASAPGTRGGTGRTRGGAAAAVALREGDTPSFAAWVASQREGMSREEAILEYVRQRGAAEPGAIGQWVSTLQPGATRERAMEIYLETLLAGSPDEAANWLRTLPRSDRSNEMMERTARRLLRTNPAAAEAWLNESTLPSYRKEELLREAGR